MANKQTHFAFSEVEENPIKRYIGGSFCPMVALVRVAPKTRITERDVDMIFPAFRTGKDGRIRSNLVLEIIRWYPEHRQFGMERRSFICPVDRNGREMAKDRPVRTSIGHEFQVGNICFSRTGSDTVGPTLHSDMTSRAAAFLSEDVENHIGLFEIPYSWEDAVSLKREPQELTDLPVLLPDFRLFAPERQTVKKTVTIKRRGNDRAQTFTSEIDCSPRFHGKNGFMEAFNRTGTAPKNLQLLDVTGDSSVELFPMTLQAYIGNLFCWKPVHVAALHSEAMGYKVRALDPGTWSQTRIVTLTENEQRVRMHQEWRDFVGSEETLKQYPGLQDVSPIEILAGLSQKRLTTLQKVSVAGEDAEKVHAVLVRKQVFRHFGTRFPAIMKMVEAQRNKWEREESSATKQDEQRDTYPLSF